jgi:hypothetical protein
MSLPSRLLHDGLLQHEHVPYAYAGDNLYEAGTIIYQPPPLFTMSVSMKLDGNKVANINFAIVVTMKISCMIGILLSRKSSLHQLILTWIIRLALWLNTFLTIME